MRLHLHEWGDPDAPTVACLHGVTAHGLRFRRVAERLADRYHVVAPDLRGHGRSTYEAPWTIEQHLEDVLEAVPADTRLWVGHSFGGRLVLELAFARPDRVARGVLLDPAIWVPGWYSLDAAEKARTPAGWASLGDAVDARLVTDPGSPRALVEEDYREHLEPSGDGRLRLRNCPSAVVATWSEMSRTPPQGRLGVPLLALRALEADVCPEPLLEAYRSTAGELLEAATLPGGHIVMWDALEETLAAIEGFLEPSSPGS